MAIIVAIVGPSGSGKSTSMFPQEKLKIKGLKPESTLIMNVSGKPLPIKQGDKLYPAVGTVSEGRRQFKNCNANDVSDVIIQVSNKVKQIKDIVVDDAQFLQAFKFMETLKEKGLIF